jgi:hypothetical protein
MASCFAKFSLKNLLQFNPKSFLGYSLAILNQRMENLNLKKNLHLTIKLTTNSYMEYKVPLES